MTQAVPDVPWRAFLALTRTGQIVESRLPWVGTPRWEWGLNQVGSLTIDIPIGVDGLSKSDLRTMLDPWRFSLGFARGAQIVQCGPIVTYRYGDGSGAPAVTVGASGMWGLLSTRRLLLNPGWDGVDVTAEAADINLAGLSLHTIAKRIVELPMQRAGSELPISLPEDIAGTAQRSYPGYDLAYVGERLMQLTQVEDGPEIEFRPRFTDESKSAVEWEMRIGNPRLGNLDYPHAWDYGKALVSIDEDVDGSRQTSLRIERGNGTERGLLTGLYADATLTTAGWPHLEDASGDHTSATDTATLASWAQAAVTTHQKPVTTWGATIRVAADDGYGNRTGSPALDEVTTGSNAVFGVREHRWIPDGDYQVRILGVSSDTLTTAKLSLQPLGG